MDEQLEFVKLIAARLEAAKIPYMMTGSMAMAIYSVPRMTRDIDLVIEIGPDKTEEIVKLFSSDCYVDSESVRQAVRNRSMFNIIHNEWIVKADFIIRKKENYRQTEFLRKKQIEIEMQNVWVATPEDLIISKLIWSRDSESETQLRDVRQLIGFIKELDWDYLQNWSKILGVDEQLVKAKGK
ncbi:MAG: hypothetical protein JXD22_05155 [Sedimentisphaerales bacterium]|nr:hypothetical protein [Sedimentisphaerales bacterium]